MPEAEWRVIGTENNNGWFKKYVMSFTYQERRAKELASFSDKVSKFKNMETVELDFEYVSMKSEYWHKHVQVLCIIAIGLTFIVGEWKVFFAYLGKILQYSASMQANGLEIVKLAFAISAFVTVGITITFFIILISNIKDTKKRYRDMLIVEEVRKKINK